METFRPYTRTKTSLAMVYFPGENPIAARKRLMRWVLGCPPLVKRLEELGYRQHQRYFSAAQVKEIIRYLGDPMPRFP